MLYAYLRIQHCPERDNVVDTVIVEMSEETALQAQHLLGAKIGLHSAAEIIQVELSGSIAPGDCHKKYSSITQFCIAANGITWKKN
ncbi:MAG: hypothetical protein WCJ74_00215 [bacterium]